MNMTDLRHAVRTPYAWPGGYPIYLILHDGEWLCHDCARSEYREISHALRHGERWSDWYPVGADVLWESPDGDEYCAHCAHCGKVIEPAYPSTENTNEP